MKRLMSLIFILLCGIIGIISVPKFDRVEASNIGSDTLKSFVLSTGGKANISKAYISFDNNQTKYEMRKIQSVSSTETLFAIFVRSSIVGDYVYFTSDNPSYGFWCKRSATIDAYRFTDSGIGSYSVSTAGNIDTILHPSASTRRLWFRFSSTIDGYPRVITGGKGYMMTSLINSKDGKSFYYVDIPASNYTVVVNYNSTTFEDGYSIVSSKTYTNETLHRINYIDMSASTKSLEPYDLVSSDANFINEYLKGFTTCLDNDVNGYKAYPYIKEITDTCSDSLDDVYQDDYLPSDYDGDNYIDGSIKEGHSVSARTKLDMIISNYNGGIHQLSLLGLDKDDHSNVVVYIIVFISSISTIVIYNVIKRRKSI